jgi:putative flippase GtrA
MMRVKSLLSGRRTNGVPLLRTMMRFALVGGTGIIVYTAVTTVLATIVGIPFQVALAIGFCATLAVHFTLQRVFVWAHHEGFALPLQHQLRRYLTVSGAQYGATAASISLLPNALGLPTEAVYIVTVLTLAAANFLLFRSRIFHAPPGSTDTVEPGESMRCRG